MEYVVLGTSGIRVSRIGFGCAAIGGWDYGAADDTESVGAIQQALAEGITLFDTADVYGFGHAENVLGRALAASRHEVVIATKCGIRWDGEGRTTRDLSPGHVRTAVEASLARLGVERIGLLQLHWPDGKTPISETLGMVRMLQEEGKVDCVGCCNFPLALVREAQQHCRLESLQLPLSFIEREWIDCVRACAGEFGMTALCYNTLGQGLLTGKFGPGASFPSSDLRSRSALFAAGRRDERFAALDALRRVAKSNGRSLAHEAILWVLGASAATVAIVGARTAAQVRENARAGRDEIGYTSTASQQSARNE